MYTETTRKAEKMDNATVLHLTASIGTKTKDLARHCLMKRGVAELSFALL